MPVSRRAILWAGNQSRSGGKRKRNRLIDIFIRELYTMENFEKPGADGMVNDRKTYYSISEVCGQIGVEPHVLRYWESEFPLLRPKKNRAGNRAYRDKDIDVVKRIKRLLYEEGFTIPGAKKKLAAVRAAEGQQMPGKDVRKELEGILELLTE